LGSTTVDKKDMVSLKCRFFGQERSEKTLRICNCGCCVNTCLSNYVCYNPSLLYILSFVVVTTGSVMGAILFATLSTLLKDVRRWWSWSNRKPLWTLTHLCGADTSLTLAIQSIYIYIGSFYGVEICSRVL